MLENNIKRNKNGSQHTIHILTPPRPLQKHLAIQMILVIKLYAVSFVNPNRVFVNSSLMHPTLFTNFTFRFELV